MRSRPALLLMAFAFLAILIVPLPIRGRLATAVLDGMHLVVGAILAAAAAYGLERWGWSAGGRRALTAVVAAAAAGGVIELIQGYMGRSASWSDALTNTIGASVWLLITCARGGAVDAADTRGRLRLAAWLGAALLIIAGLWFPARQGYDAVRQASAFPMLGSFEDELELSRLNPLWSTASLSTAHVTDGAASLHVALHTGRYPGVTLDHLAGDWTPYAALEFDVYVVGNQALPLVLKIEDHHHDSDNYDYYDRYHQEMSLAPGAHRIRIPMAEIEAGPKERKLDLTEMARIQWHLDGLEGEREMHLDAVRLVRQ